MGIHGLYDLLDAYNIGKPITEKEFKVYNPIGMDASIVAHRAIKGVPNIASLTDADGRPTAQIKNALDLSIKMYKNNTLAFWVFDGKPPEIKSNEIDKRQNSKDVAEDKLQEIQDMIDSIKEFTDDDSIIDAIEGNKSSLEKQSFIIDENVINPMKELFDHMGIPYIQSVEEADITLFKLCDMGICKSVYSTDSDLLIYGCPILIRPMVRKNKDGKIIKRDWNVYHLQDIYNKLSINREELIVIALTLGCDYAPKIKGIGIESIKRLLISKSILSLKSKFTDVHKMVYNRFISPPEYPFKINIKPINMDALVDFLKEKRFTTSEKYKEKLISLGFDYGEFIK